MKTDVTISCYSWPLIHLAFFQRQHSAIASDSHHFHKRPKTAENREFLNLNGGEL